jgi:hypothetical protein
MGLATAYFLATSGKLPPNTTIWIVDPRLRKDGKFERCSRDALTP